MKKLICLSTTIMTICLSLLIINIFRTQEVERINHIEQSPYSVTFYLKNSPKTSKDILHFYNQLAKQYNVSIVKTDNHNQTVIKSVIATKTFPAGNFGLKKVDFNNHPNGVYANYQTKHQLGHITTFLNPKPILLQSLSSYFKDQSRSINGTYRIVSTKPFNQKAVLQRLSTFFETSSKELTQTQTHLVIGYVNQNLIITSLIFIISAIILILSAVYLPLTEMKAIGVKKLLGYTNLTILFEFIRFSFLTIAIVSAIIDLLCFLLLRAIPSHFFLALILGQLILIIINSLLNVGVYTVIQHITITKMLKGFVNFRTGIWLNYLLKTGMTILLALLLIIMSKSLTDMNRSIAYQEQWDTKGSQFITIETYKLSDNLNQDFLSDTASLNPYFSNLYLKLEKETKAQYIYSEILHPNHSFSSSLTIMHVNANYLNHISLALPKKITSSNSKVFLLPHSYKKKEKQIRPILQEEAYNLLSYDQQKATSVANTPITIRYYNQNISLFPYSENIKTDVHNPIFALVTDNLWFEEAAYLANTGVNNPIKIPASSKNSQKAQQIVAKYGEGSQIKLSSLHDIQGNNIDSFKDGIFNISLLVSILLILNTVISYFMVSILFICKQKYLTTMKFLGWTLIDRYKKMLVTTICIYLSSLVIVTILGKEWQITLGFAIYILFDSILLLGFALHNEKQQLTKQLKGGK